MGIRFTVIGLCLAGILGGSGCRSERGGGGSYDNLAACEDFFEAVNCGGYDFSRYLDCSNYSTVACDVEDYFLCLEENTLCNPSSDVPDTSGWTNCTGLDRCDAVSSSTSEPTGTTPTNTYDNVEACEAYIDTARCGDVDASQYVDCDAYAQTPCDLSEYFECLADNTACDPIYGTLDPSGWASCTGLHQCPLEGQ